MRLSTALRNDILSPTVGCVLNKFKLLNRRDTLFFEEIPAYYVRECELAGYSRVFNELGFKWGFLSVNQLLPSPLRLMPLSFLVNEVMSKVWLNLGLLEGCRLSIVDDRVFLETKKECITQIIGPNEFVVGLHSGILSALSGSRLCAVDVQQSRESCRYALEMTQDPVSFSCKPLSEYQRLNRLPAGTGFTLKDALNKGVFRLSADNRLFFRDKGVTPIENTIFHLVGFEGIMLDVVADVSRGLFEGSIEEDASFDNYLLLLKNLLQVMGWGIFKITLRSNRDVCVEISNPPFGFQSGKDNWYFLAYTILGYLRFMDDFSLESYDVSAKGVSLRFVA